MQANLLELFSSVSAFAVGTSEPVVLLVLGGLFILLSFMRVRVRRTPTKAPAPAVPARSIPDAGSPLAAHQQ